jgi:hypothetical protein
MDWRLITDHRESLCSKVHYLLIFLLPETIFLNIFVYICWLMFCWSNHQHAHTHKKTLTSSLFRFVGNTLCWMLQRFAAPASVAWSVSLLCFARWKLAYESDQWTISVSGMWFTSVLCATILLLAPWITLGSPFQKGTSWFWYPFDWCAKNSRFLQLRVFT